MQPTHIFRDLPEVIALTAGDYVFHQGEPGKFMYLIVEGDIDLLSGNRVVETAGEGSFIGEMALIEDAPRSASARARTAARVFPIDQQRFNTLIRDTPPFALDLMKVLAHRLRSTTAKIARAKAKRPIGRPTRSHAR